MVFTVLSLVAVHTATSIGAAVTGSAGGEQGAPRSVYLACISRDSMAARPTLGTMQGIPPPPTTTQGSTLSTFTLTPGSHQRRIINVYPHPGFSPKGDYWHLPSPGVLTKGELLTLTSLPHRTKGELLTLTLPPAPNREGLLTLTLILHTQGG